MSQNDKNIDILNDIYRKSEEVDKDLFAEQRSNILLVAGEHYSKSKSKYWDRIRDNKDLTDQQKIRITKNHIQKIVKTYVNNILTQAPGATIVPANESEIQDQKTAELNKSVWSHYKKKKKMNNFIAQMASDFIDLGECAAKIFWDQDKGDFVGYEQAVDDFGNPVFDENGQPQAGDKPVFSGDAECERVFGFNLLRSPSAKSMDDSPYLIYRKMVNKKDLEKKFQGDEEKLKLIQETKDDTFVVFDTNKNKMEGSKDQVMIREFYYKPCMEYPEGYFYITTELGILAEGVLPKSHDGTILYPIIYCGFDELKTTPRHRSIIKQLRPYQVEINREASQQAANSIIHGDDKIYTMAGSKVSPAGGSQPGIRQYTYTGIEPKIVPGRAGEQFLVTINSNIDEMYKVANVFEDTEKQDANVDPFNLLYRSVRNKKKFVTYAEKFESFVVQMVEMILANIKAYSDDNYIVPMIGKKEMVNIQEFRSSDKLSTRIIVEPMDDDIDSMMGKQLALNHVIQYAGGQLEKEEIGKVLRAMPFANFEESFDDLTIDHDTIKNDMLAMERGEYFQANKYDNHKYAIKRLTARMRQSDFKFLDPNVQSYYAQKLQEHEQFEAQIAQEIMAAKSEFIPIDGYLVTVQMKMVDSQGTEKQVRLPYSSLDWLIKRLEAQGSAQDTLEKLNQGAVADIARMSLGQ